MQTYSNKIHLNSLDYLSIDLDLKETSIPIALERLFEVGIRSNKKRVFLFISKVLGKHLAIDPTIPLIAGQLLAYQYSGLDLAPLLEYLEQESRDKELFNQLYSKKIRMETPTLIIGFAETATGLAHSLFQTYEGPVSYIHTTREQIISEKPCFTFEEVHSHATAHRCYSEETGYFDRFKNIVLVDDEITTGHTALHLIEALDKKSPHFSYTVVSLLDWRNEEEQKEAIDLAESLGIQIHFVSLIQGQMTAQLSHPLPQEWLQSPSPLLVQESERLMPYETLPFSIGETITKYVQDGLGVVQELTYSKTTGRFGLDAEQNRRNEQSIRKIGQQLKRLRTYKKCLVIGTEELIYIPCLIAAEMGENVYYQSSTRSPIIAQNKEGYPIKCVTCYKRPEDTTVTNYLYNIVPHYYEEVFWILERDVKPKFKQEMANYLGRQAIKKVTFVTLDQEN